MAEHKLKTWANAWDAVADGRKTFEWRQDDRGFEVGDVLVLKRWDCGLEKRGDSYVPKIPSENKPPELRVRVTYILRGMFGVPPGFCVMAIRREDA